MAFKEEVVAMHRAKGSAIWMERPLPTKLIQYAANDIYLISVLFEYFVEKQWITQTGFPDLLVKSKRYVSMHKDQGRSEDTNFFRRGPLLPMDILTVGREVQGKCRGCGRQLSTAAYETKMRTAKKEVNAEMRRTRCRNCRVIAFKRRLPSEEHLWIKV